MAVNDESATKKLERSTCEWPGAVRPGGVAVTVPHAHDGMSKMKETHRATHLSRT